MFVVLLLLFTLMPLLELWLLFKLSGMFGFFPTIATVLLTGIVGAGLARWQGWQALSRMRSEMRQGVLPTGTMGDGALILVAGILLITPGVITDAVGLLLLLPPVRMLVRAGLKLWLAKHVRVETNAFWQAAAQQRRDDPNVVEGRVVDAKVID